MSDKRKIKIVFPFVEAGFGHIMTERSICNAMEKKYGDYVEIVRTNFYSDGNSEAMKKYEKRLCDEVRSYNRHHTYANLTMMALSVFGKKVSSWFTIQKIVKGAYKDSLKYMESLSPDVVISTHWATNYYAEHLKKKPFTVTYVPDARANGMFRYPTDLTLIGTREGYEELKKHRNYNDDNLKQAPLAIREEAFSITRDKKALREKLGLSDKFTVYITDGGYGIGLTESLVNRLIDEDLPISIIAVCGKNPELYNKLKLLKPKKNTSFYPFGFAENALELIASSDIYFGKSGNGLMEPAFFGVPTVVTHSANSIEVHLADHYVKYVKSAVRIFEVEPCVEFIKKAIVGDESYEKLKNANTSPADYGGEGIADIIFDKLDEKFHLRDGSDKK